MEFCQSEKVGTLTSSVWRLWVLVFESGNVFKPLHFFPYIIILYVYNIIWTLPIETNPQVALQ